MNVIQTKSATMPTPDTSGTNGGVGRNLSGAQVPSADAAETSLVALIDRALADADTPDPHAIARQIARDLPAGLRDTLIHAGLAARVRERIRGVRTIGVATRKTGPSKWSTMRQPVCVAGEWKFEDECDYSDLLTLAEQYRELAAKNSAQAQKYQTLADELRESGCVTVGELWTQKDLAV